MELFFSKHQSHLLGVSRLKLTDSLQDGFHLNHLNTIIIHHRFQIYIAVIQSTLQSLF